MQLLMSSSSTSRSLVTYHTLGRVNFYVPGDSNFASTSPGSMRKKPMGGIFTFGAFTANIGDTLYAYNVAIDSNGNVDPVYGASNLYPVVSYQTDNLGTVIVNANTIPLTTGIISASTTYPITNVFCRLNGCPAIDLVTGSNASITVPVTAGTCFFRVDNALYLLRPADAKSVGFSLSRGSSAASSAAGTPTGSESSPSPAPVSASASPSVSPAIKRPPQTFVPPAPSLTPAPVVPKPEVKVIQAVKIAPKVAPAVVQAAPQPAVKPAVVPAVVVPVSAPTPAPVAPKQPAPYNASSVQKRVKEMLLKNDCLYYIDVLPKLHWMSSPSFLEYSTISFCCRSFACSACFVLPQSFHFSQCSFLNGM